MYIELIVINLATHKVVDKRELLFNKPALKVGLLTIQTKCDQKHSNDFYKLVTRKGVAKQEL